MALGSNTGNADRLDLSCRARVRREALWAALGSTAFALVFGWPVVLGFFRIGLANDWDYQMELHWVPFYTVTHFHQFPLWNPYKCGGMPMLGNPQSRILTPFFLFHLLFGPLIGLHIEVIAHLAIAFGGAYFLARVLRISKVGAVTCAGAFAGSSWYYLHLAAGHAVFMSSAYVPWIVALFQLGSDRRRMTFAAPAGLLMALIFMEAGIYTAPHAALMLVLLALMLSMERQSVFPILVLAAIGAFTVTFAAPKLLPTLRLLGPGARGVDAFEVNSASMFLQELFSQNQDFPRSLTGGFWGFHEYGAYIGVLFASFATAGIVLRFNRALPWLIVSIVFIALAAGNYGSYAPWTLLHHVPIFSAQHAPTRFLILVTLATGVLAGLGTDAIAEVREPIGKGVAITLIALALIDCWSVSSPNLRYTLGADQPPIQPSLNFRQLIDPNDRRMFMMSKANLGAIVCYEPANPGNSAYGSNQPGYRGEQHLEGPGEVGLSRWTPNVLDYGVDARGPALVIVNQNFNPAWRIAKGQGEIFPHHGLIAVRVPAGNQRLRIEYRDTAAIWGAAIFMLGILAALALWWLERHAGRSREMA